MTLALVSQAGAEVLYRVTPRLKVSQAGVEYLHRVLPGMKVSQAGVEYLHRVKPSFSVSQAGAEVLFKSLPCTTSRAQIWTIARTDGEVLRFTSLDRDLSFGGHVYASCNSLVPSASESVAEVGAVGNIQLSGLIAAGAVTMADLHAGRFDGASVEAWLVPWKGTQAPRLLLRGTFAKVQYSESGFRVDVLGDGGKLTQTPLVHTLQPGCRWLFGDERCGKDLGPLTVTGAAESGAGQRAFTDAGRTEPPGYFSAGRVTFTSGLNEGLSAEIKEHAAGGVFTLWPRLAFAIAAGDEYAMKPGCTNLKASAGGTNGCTAWANTLRYGGFDKVPGSDAVKKSADVKQG